MTGERKARGDGWLVRRDECRLPIRAAPAGRAVGTFVLTVRPADTQHRLPLGHIRGSFGVSSPMPFVWVGLLLIVLKWFGVTLVADWSWWIVLAPLVLAFTWFELIEPLTGLDRRRLVDDEQARRHERRLARDFPQWRARSRSRRLSRD